MMFQGCPGPSWGECVSYSGPLGAVSLRKRDCDICYAQEWNYLTGHWQPARV